MERSKTKTSLTYSENNDALVRYRKLAPSGINLRVLMGDSNNSVALTGIDSNITIGQLRRRLSPITGNNLSRFRLFLGGQQLTDDELLLDYFKTSHFCEQECSLKLRCFIPLLISSLDCPGSMLSELEVATLNDEPVCQVKRKIRDKFRIECDDQRLYLHPTEMTSFSRRRPLDDARLLSSYLNPGCDKNFIEVVVVQKQRPSSNRHFVRIPMRVLKLNGEEVKGVSWTIQNDKQSFPSMFDLWWLTVPLNMSEIVRRDPTVKDVSHLLSKHIKNVLKSTSRFGIDEIESLNDQVKLKFCNSRTLHGGSELNIDDTIYKSCHFRSEEMLLFVADPLLNDRINKSPNATENKNAPSTVEKMNPILPLRQYDDNRNRFTMPLEANKFHWDISPSTPVDCGAKPSAEMEFSAVSYARTYGTWDIPKHSKTYVEINLEGTFRVGDGRLEALLVNNDNHRLGRDHDIDEIVTRNGDVNLYSENAEVTYYVFDAVELLILGPSNPLNNSQRSISSYLRNPAAAASAGRSPTSRFSDDGRMNKYNNRLLPSAHFRLQRADKCVLKTSPLENAQGDKTTLSETLLDLWYVDRERVTDVSPWPAGKSRRGQAPVSTTCSRGVSAEGRGYLSVVYRGQVPIQTDGQLLVPKANWADALRTAFDFRIQAQFYICSALDSQQNKLPESAKFTVQVRHCVARVQHRPHLPDVVTPMSSPEIGMETSVDVALATPTWHQASGLPLSAAEPFDIAPHI